MKKLFLCASIALALCSTAKAQSAKSIFAELGGPGLASINYDMRLSPKQDGLGFRVGFGGFSVEGSSLITVPLGLNYLLGKDGRNYFELGAGATILSASSDDIDSETFSGSFGHLNLGYRLQPTNSGFTFRAAINPIFGEGGFVPFYGGISFGYKF